MAARRAGTIPEAPLRGSAVRIKSTWTVIFECEVIRGSRLPLPFAQARPVAQAASMQASDYFLVDDEARVRLVGMEFWVDGARPQSQWQHFVRAGLLWVWPALAAMSVVLLAGVAMLAVIPRH